MDKKLLLYLLLVETLMTMDDVEDDPRYTQKLKMLGNNFKKELEKVIEDVFENFKGDPEANEVYSILQTSFSRKLDELSVENLTCV